MITKQETPQFSVLYAYRTVEDLFDAMALILKECEGKKIVRKTILFPNHAHCDDGYVGAVYEEIQ